MKVELTKLQAEKILEALKDKFQGTHDAFWLGLQHNLESQLYYKEQKKPYVIEWMKNEFGVIANVVDPFGRTYDAKPVFVELERLKRDWSTVEENVGGIAVRIKTGSPTSLTKSYPVYYQILTPKN